MNIVEKWLTYIHSRHSKTAHHMVGHAIKVIESLLHMAAEVVTRHKLAVILSRPSVPTVRNHRLISLAHFSGKLYLELKL